MHALAPALRRLSVRCLYPKLDLRPDRCAVTGALGQSARHDSGFYFTQHRNPADLARRRRAVIRNIQKFNQESRNPGNVSELENRIMFLFIFLLSWLPN